MEENKNIDKAREDKGMNLPGPSALTTPLKTESEEQLHIKNTGAESLILKKEEADFNSASPPAQQSQIEQSKIQATVGTPTHEPQTETMEIHHHGHVHEQKKWKEYLFQFLMFFLAVFCGFLAEYQLEHVFENTREKQFMKSMVEDLEKDALLLENESRLVKLQYGKLDSLTDIIYEGTLNELHVRKMYELQRRYLSPQSLRLINRTELQLKNSGGMRLIRNTQVADSIINYWSITELLYETKDNINLHRGRAKDISFTLFSNKYYKHTYTEDFSLAFPLDSSKGEPELITKNPAVLSEFANRISHMNDLLKFNYKQRRVDRQAVNARNLVRLIKKEYSLK